MDDRRRFLRRFFASAAATAAVGATMTVIYVIGGNTALNRTAHVFVSPLGNDATCTRNAGLVGIADALSSHNACATWDKAYHVAQQGDAVPVEPGAYTPGNPALSDDASKTTNGSYVTFECDDSRTENITFNPGVAASFEQFFFITADHVKIDGGGNWRTGTPSCMRFHAIRTSNLGSSQATDTILTGLHMQKIDALGAVTATISNSEIGPSTACHVQSWPTPSQRCQSNSQTGEDWYYANPTIDGCDVGGGANHIGSGGGVNGSGIAFTNDWIHDFNTRDATNCHGGGLSQLGAADTVTVAQSKFEQNIVYDFFYEGDVSNLTMENNWIGAPVNSYESGCSYHTCTESGSGQALQIDDRGGLTAVTNWLVRFNTMSGGVSLKQASCGCTNSYTNVRWIGNLETAFDCTNSSGMTIDANATVGGLTCGTHNTNLASLGVVSPTGYPINFTPSGVPSLPTVSQTTPGTVTFGADDQGAAFTGTSAALSSQTYANGSVYALDLFERVGSGTPATAGLTVAGGTMTFARVASCDLTGSGVSNSRYSVWVGVGDGNASTVTVTSPDSLTDAWFDLYHVAGAKTTSGGLDAVHQCVTGGAGSGTPSLTLAALQTGGLASGYAADNQTITGPGSGYTQIRYTTGALDKESEYGTSTAVAWGVSGSGIWNAVAYELTGAASTDYQIAADYFNAARSDPTLVGSVGP